MSASLRLADAIRRAGTPLCVGIDPWPDRLPGRARLASPSHADLARLAEDFGLAVVAAARGRVPAVKPQFAFFESLGPLGMAALATICTAARDAGLIVIGDAKRGDIGSTAGAYAAATLAADAPFPSDWLTVSPFLGPDTLEPYLAYADRGIFVLLRTSNPGSARWQAPVAEDLSGWLEATGAARADEDGLSPIGAVVGATKGAEIAAWRERMPHVWLLVPGLGAQGGSVADARRALRPDGLGALFPTSRSVTFPDAPDAAYDRAPLPWMIDRIDAAKASLC